MRSPRFALLTAAAMALVLTGTGAGAEKDDKKKESPAVKAARDLTRILIRPPTNPIRGE